jgi:hypothetical protein
MHIKINPYIVIHSPSTQVFTWLTDIDKGRIGEGIW